VSADSTGRMYNIDKMLLILVKWLKIDLSLVYDEDDALIPIFRWKSDEFGMRI
jgi:hypothetical protein